jgi:3-hydroxyacyl-CoA dehydrogenase
LSAPASSAGWAVRLNGIDVTLFDPDPEAERKVDQVLKGAERAYRKLTLAPLERSGRITCTADLEAAVAKADFIQQSAPERKPLKRSLLRCSAGSSIARVHRFSKQWLFLFRWIAGYL